MRMRVLREKLRVEIENETRVFLESLNFEIEMRVSQKSESGPGIRGIGNVHCKIGMCGLVSKCVWFFHQACF